MGAALFPITPRGQSTGNRADSRKIRLLLPLMSLRASRLLASALFSENFLKQYILIGFFVLQCRAFGIFIFSFRGTQWNRKNPVRLSLAKRWDVMIRVHAAVERNTNSAVERINKFQILKYKFPVSEKLIPGFFKKKN